MDELTEVPSFEELHPYFTKALQYLTNEGRAFSSKYPQVARALQIDESDIKDPDVRRLIESFALFDARLSWSIDHQKDVFANFLLSLIAPELLVVQPAATIIELSSTVKSAIIPKHTEFFVTSFSGKRCRFRTARDHQLILGEILKISLIYTIQDHKLKYLNSDSAILIKLNLREQHDKILLYVNSDSRIADLILQSILTVNPDRGCRVFDYYTGKVAGHVRPCSDYGSFVDPKLLGNPYHVLHQYSILRNIVQFFELHLLTHASTIAELLLIIPLNDKVKLRTNYIHDRVFLLNCIPAANIFKKRSEPVTASNLQESYNIIPDIDDDLYHAYRLESLNVYDPRSSATTVYERHGIDYHMQILSQKHMRVWLKNMYDATINLHGCSIYADLLCTNGEHGYQIANRASVTIENFNYIKGQVLVVPSANAPTKISDKWSLLSLCFNRELEVMQKEDKMITLINQVHQMYGLSIPGDIFTSVRTSCGPSVVHSKSAWKGMFYKSITEITLNSVSEAFMIAMLWAKVLNDSCRVGLMSQIRILEPDGQVLQSIGEEDGRS